MAGCGCNYEGGERGPFSKGKALVEFVYNAHGGTIRDQPLSRGAMDIVCQGCQASFTLETYVGKCPQCGGIHAVAPMNPVAENVQFAGDGFTLPS